MRMIFSSNCCIYLIKVYCMHFTIYLMKNFDRNTVYSVANTMIYVIVYFNILCTYARSFLLALFCLCGLIIFNVYCIVFCAYVFMIDHVGIFVISSSYLFGYRLPIVLQSYSLLFLRNI